MTEPDMKYLKYKTDQERVYKRSQLEEAYADLKEKLKIASKLPSNENRASTTLSAVAKANGIKRNAFWHFVQMKTYE